MNNNFIRSGQNNNNNRNRNRNRNNNSNNNTNNRRSNMGGGSSSNKVFDSNGPDVKLRGTTQTIAEKYMQLGRDAQSAGDNVAAENYYQHAEHYYRLWAASQPMGQPLTMSRKFGEEEYDEDGNEQPRQDDDNGDNNNNNNNNHNAPQQNTGSEQNEQQGENQQPMQGQDDNGGDNPQNGDRPYRNNRERFKPRWQNRRNDRDNAGPREGGDQPQGVTDDAPAVAAATAPEPAPQAEGQWEAPGFLQRPVTIPAETAEAPEAEAIVRKPRTRRPRVEAEVATPDTPAETE